MDDKEKQKKQVSNKKYIRRYLSDHNYQDSEKLYGCKNFNYFIFSIQHCQETQTHHLFKGGMMKYPSSPFYLSDTGYVPRSNKMSK